MSTKPFCPKCGLPCKAVRCDDGVGPIEFWGAKTVDSRPYTGSDCCGAKLDDCDAFDDSDRADYEYDRMRDDKLTGDLE